MIEMGSDGMAANQASTMKMVMRVLAVVMIPATMHFNSGLFVYWGANNMISIIQTGVMKLGPVRKALSIPTMPTPESTPELKLANSLNPIQTYMRKFKEKTEQEKDARVEIHDGVRRKPPPPPDAHEDSNSFSQTKPRIYSSARNKSKKKS